MQLAFYAEIWLLRSFVTDVIYKYLECGDLHFGFARVKCCECKHEYLLPFSCKCRHFCPSCHQRRVVEFGEWLCEEVLKKLVTDNGFSVYQSGSGYILCMIESCLPNSVSVPRTYYPCTLNKVLPMKKPSPCSLV